MECDAGQGVRKFPSKRRIPLVFVDAENNRVVQMVGVF